MEESMHQGQEQVETIREKFEEMLKPIESNMEVIKWRNFRKLVAVYLCTAEEQEEECAGFLPNANGECCFKVFKDGMKTCEWRES